jgi:BirA family biotin operon repressor/biotin-[acetyl-CoA-carboxylase] ligase
MNFRVIRVKVCGSTNDEVKDMARAGAEEGTAVVALEQTAGRGTKGRGWHSARGLGLYVSVLLRPPAAVSLSLLPLAAGLAARDAVEKASGLIAGLRWPNDVVWEGKKLGGILCETEFSGSEVVFAVVGLGLNLFHRPLDFPADIRDLSVSVVLAGGRWPAAEAVLEAYLKELLAWYAELREGRPLGLVRGFEFHSVLKPGDPVRIAAAEGLREGRYLGLAADGTLRAAFREGERRFASADVIRLIN